MTEGERNSLEVERETVKGERQAPMVAGCRTSPRFTAEGSALNHIRVSGSLASM